MRRTRVLIVLPFWEGGITHYVHSLANSLGALSLSVSVIVPVPYELNGLPRRFSLVEVPQIAWIFRQEGIVHRLTRKLVCVLAVDRLIYFLAMVVFMARTRPGVLHCQWIEDTRLFRLSVELAKSWKIECVYTAHNVLPHDMDPTDTA